MHKITKQLWGVKISILLRNSQNINTVMSHSGGVVLVAGLLIMIIIIIVCAKKGMILFNAACAMSV